MKTAEHISTSRNLQRQKASHPVFHKDGESSLFSETQTDVQAFFAPSNENTNRFFFNKPHTIQTKPAIGEIDIINDIKTDAVTNREVEHVPQTDALDAEVISTSQGVDSMPIPFNVQVKAQPEREETKEEEHPVVEEEIQRKLIFESNDDGGDESVQTKLSIGQPGDKNEQEADAVVNQVVEIEGENNKPTQEPVSNTTPAPQVLVQPEFEEAKEEENPGQEEEIQRKPIFESNDDGNEEVPSSHVLSKNTVLQRAVEEETNFPEEQLVEKPNIEDERGVSKNEAMEADIPNVTSPEELHNELDGFPESDTESQAEESLETVSAPISETDVVDSPETPENTQEQESVPNSASGIQEEASAVTEEVSTNIDRSIPALEEETSIKEQSLAAQSETPNQIDPPEKSSESGTSEGYTTPPSTEEKTGAEGASSGSSGKETEQMSETAKASQETKMAESATTSSGTLPSEATKTSAENGKTEEDKTVDASVPIETNSYAFPPADEQLPGPLPEPVSLGIKPAGQEKLIQSKGATENPKESLESQLQQSKGRGQNLDEVSSESMGREIGADFSNVKIHTDDKAVNMNKELGAKAFTHGKDIYFNEGEFDASSEDGKHLLAHELTHTVQQGAVSAISPKMEKASSPISSSPSPSIQTSRWSAVKKIGGAVGGKARSAIIGQINKVGSDAIKNIQDQAADMMEEWKQKATNWKDQLLGQATEFLDADKLKNFLLGEAKSKAEALLGIKQGEGDVDQGLVPDVLPDNIKSMLESVQGFASGQDGGETVFGVDQEAELVGMQEQVEQDASSWKEVEQVTNALAPYAGDKEENVKNLVSAFGKLKESNWTSREAWLELFEAGKGFVPGLDGMIESGKKALSEGIGQLKERISQNAKKLWESGSKLGKRILKGAEKYKQRALQTAKRFGRNMSEGARKVGGKLMASVKRLGGRGAKLAGTLKSKIGMLGGKVGKFASNAISKGSSLLRKVPGKVGRAAKSVFRSVKNRLGKGKGRFRKIMSKGKHLVKGIGKGLKNKLKKGLRFVKRSASTAIRKGKALFKKGMNKAKQVWQKATAKGKRLIKKSMAKVKNILSRSKEWLKKKVVNPVKDMLKKAKDRISSFVKGMKEKLKEKYNALKQKLAEWWGIKVGFKTKSGKPHLLSFKGKERSAKLILASNNPGPIQLKVKRILNGEETDVEIIDRSALENVLLEAQKLDKMIAQHESTGTGETTSVQGAIQEHLNEIKKNLEKGFDDKLEDLTNVTYETEEGRAKTVTAQPLTKESGNTKGSIASGNPPGWKIATYLNSHRKYQDESSGKERKIIEWNKVHLLSADLHGPGDQNWNLTPANQTANSGLLSIEREAKKNIHSNPPVNYRIYKVVVAYNNPNNPTVHSDPNVGEWNPKDFPSAIDAYIQKENEASPKKIPIAKNLPYPTNNDVPQEVDYFGIFSVNIDRYIRTTEKEERLDWSTFSRRLSLSRRIPDEAIRKDVTKRLRNYYNENK